MTIEQIKEKLRSEEYDFLRKDKNLGNNIIILTLGGSHAYGTNTEKKCINGKVKMPYLDVSNSKQTLHYLIV